MNIRTLAFFFTSFFITFTVSSQTLVIVDDDLTNDGTAQTDAAYFGSSGASAIEKNPNSIGLVSGSTSRQIHALFETQTLANPNDRLEVTVAFTTPDTVATTGFENFRFGLFDHLERTAADQLGQNTSYNSSNPNELYSGLPGFFTDIDVRTNSSSTNLEVLTSDPSTSGRLLATRDGFTSQASGPSSGFQIEPNTTYVLYIQLTRTDDDELFVFIEFSDNFGSDEPVYAFYSRPLDAEVSSFNFGMLSVSASSDAVGSSNVAGIADNGIEIDAVFVDFSPTDNPPAAVNDDTCFPVKSENGTISTICF